MKDSDIFNLIRSAVNMHDDRNSLEKFKAISRKFILELEEKGRTDDAGFIECIIGDTTQYLQVLEDMTPPPLKEMKFLKISQDNIKQIRALSNDSTILKVGGVLLFDYDNLLAYITLTSFKRLQENHYINATSIDIDTLSNSGEYETIRQKLRG